MPAPSKVRGAHSEEATSFTLGIRAKHPTKRKESTAVVAKATLPFENSSKSDNSRPDKNGGRPSQPRGSAYSVPSHNRNNPRNTGLKNCPSECFSTDAVTSNQTGGRHSSSSASLQSMAAQSSSEDPTTDDNNPLSMLSGQHAGPRQASYLRGRDFLINIHAEVWIDALASGDPESRTNTGVERDLIQAHNREVPHPLPRMRRTAHPREQTWVVEVMDDSDSSPRSTQKNLDLDSPEFWTNDPQWRASVRATWSFLRRNFPQQPEDIFNEQDISISAEPVFTLLELARIAQAIIHFEPALDEVIMPGGDRSRNWRDNPNLGGATPRLSRAESIHRIERLFAQPSSQGILGNPIWQLQNLMACHDRQDYRWSFSSEDPYLSICFARSAGEESAVHLVQWASFVSSFVQAAVSCPSPAQLQRVPPNRTGLRQFLAA